MTTKIRLRLLDALESCQTIRQYTDGSEFDSYLRDIQRRDAGERRLAIIDEALHRAEALEPTLANRLPELREIVGMRNRLIHGCAEVNDKIVWDVVQDKLPSLQARLADLLGEPEPQ